MKKEYTTTANHPVADPHRFTEMPMSTSTCDNSQLPMQEKTFASCVKGNGSITEASSTTMDSFWSGELLVANAYSEMQPVYRDFEPFRVTYSQSFNHYSDYGWPNRQDTLSELEQYLGVEIGKDHADFNEEIDAGALVEYSEVNNAVEADTDVRPCHTLDVILSEWNRSDHLHRLDFTKRALYMERDVLKVEPRGREEYLFTRIIDDTSFELHAPFNDHPICELLAFPVNEEMLDLLSNSLPNFCPAMLWERDGFEKFAHDHEWKGTEYRGMLLRQLAYKRVYRDPQATELSANFALSPVSEYRQSLTRTQKRRDRRTRRIEANAMEGATPTGRRMERVPKRLFREDNEESVKRRRLDFDE